MQSLASLKTRAKDDMGKTYWIYPDEEEVNFFEQTNVLETRPSEVVAKNNKWKNLALLNREIIDAIVGESFEEI